MLISAPTLPRLLLLLLLFSCLIVLAQPGQSSDGIVYRTQSNEGYGASKNINGKEIVILAPVYDRYGRLNRNLIRVKKDDLFGLYDSNGKEILPIVYEKIMATKSIGGFILIRLEGRYGALFADGSEALSASFQHLEIIAEGHLLAKQNDLWVLYGPNLEQLFEQPYDDIIYDSRGAKYVAQSGDEKFIVGLDGKVRNAPVFDQIDRCFEGYCRVRAGDKWGYVNAQGEVLVPLEYDWIDDRVRKGVARATKNGKMGWITPRNNQVILDFQYDEVDIASSIAKVVFMKNEGKVGWLNKKGEIMVLPTYLDVQNRAASDGVYLVISTERKYGVVNWKNEILVPIEYDRISTVYNGLVTYKVADQWGIMTVAGEKLTATIYDHPPSIIESYGYIIVRKDDLYGLINRAGEEVHPIIYKAIEVKAIYKGAGKPKPIVAKVTLVDGTKETLELKVLQPK